MIIVEGPDLIGKTTLIEEIRRQAGGRGCLVKHYGLMPDDWRYPRDYCRCMLESAEDDRLVVYDRFYLSEVVYGSAIRDESRVSPQQLIALDGLLKAAGGLTIVMHANPFSYAKILEKRWREGEAFDRQQCRHVNFIFHSLVTSGHSVYRTERGLHFWARVDYCISCPTPLLIEQIARGILHTHDTQIDRSAIDEVLKAIGDHTP